MLACTALVGCTNEDVIDNPNENPVNGETNKAYVSVKMVMTESTGSRATEDGGYDKGDVSEQKINSANSIFLFYDEDGNWVTSGQLISAESFSEENQGNHGHNTEYNINDIYDDAYVVLSSPNDDIKKIKQVLTVVNYSNCSSLKQLKKDQALEVIANENGNDPYNEGFLMSTSVYMNGEDLVNTTAILGEDVENADGTTKKANIQATQKDAKGNPVKIYIERASAKIQLTYGENMTLINKATEFEVKGSVDGNGDEAGGQEGNDIVIDGVQYPVVISIDGWTVNNINETSYLVKQTEESWTEAVPFKNWSNANDYRSYWAKGTKYEISATEGNGLTIYDYNDAIGVLSSNASGLTNNAMYCYEQTVQNPAASKGTVFPNVTTMLIAASIKIQKPATTEGGTAITETVGDIFEYGGVFYTKDNYLNLILRQIQEAGYMKQVTTTTGEGEDVTTETSYASLNANDLAIISDGTLAGIKITVGDGAYVKDVKEVTGEDGTKTYTSTESSDDEINAFLNGGTIGEGETAKEFDGLDYIIDAEAFAGGKCYYQIPIEHLSSTAETPLYGVVRNHWYKLNISEVKRIGSAVYNPEVLIPQIPEQETSYYLAAELHVLSWHVVNQGVVLE